jgi:hypothetical protein
MGGHVGQACGIRGALGFPSKVVRHCGGPTCDQMELGWLGMSRNNVAVCSFISTW